MFGGRSLPHPCADTLATYPTGPCSIGRQEGSSWSRLSGVDPDCFKLVLGVLLFAVSRFLSGSSSPRAARCAASLDWAVRWGIAGRGLAPSAATSPLLTHSDYRVPCMYVHTCCAAAGMACGSVPPRRDQPLHHAQLLCWALWLVCSLCCTGQHKLLCLCAPVWHTSLHGLRYMRPCNRSAKCTFRKRL